MSRRSFTLGRDNKHQKEKDSVVKALHALETATNKPDAENPTGVLSGLEECIKVGLFLTWYFTRFCL